MKIADFQRRAGEFRKYYRQPEVTEADAEAAARELGEWFHTSLDEFNGTDHDRRLILGLLDSVLNELTTHFTRSKMQAIRQKTRSLRRILEGDE